VARLREWNVWILRRVVGECNNNLVQHACGWQIRGSNMWKSTPQEVCVSPLTVAGLCFVLMLSSET
jgi:hypothetical protein